VTDNGSGLAAEPTVEELARLMADVTAMMIGGSWAQIDAQMERLGTTIDVADHVIALAYLRLTFPFRSRLLQWQPVLATLQEALRKAGLDEKRTLRGLLP
jgi:hypothetical protein